MNRHISLELIYRVDKKNKKGREISKRNFLPTNLEMFDCTYIRNFFLAKESHFYPFY